MNSMNNIDEICRQQNCTNIQYNKLVTSGNDPSITKAMRYSQYVQNANPKRVYVSGSASSGLAAGGITFHSYFSPVLVSLQFTNLKDFNMSRYKTFSRTNVK